MSKISIDDFHDLMLDIEADTGFVCYETMPGDQKVWYGTSGKFDDFKTAAADALETGTIVFIIDTNKRYCYSSYTETWYEI